MSKYIDAEKLIAEIERLPSSDHLIEYEPVEKLAYNRALVEIEDAITSLQQEQPEGLDEAAEESAKRWRKNPDGSESREMLFQPHIRGFKAGAEWMAGQFEKNRLEALSKVKALRDAQNMHAKTLNYGYRCLAIRLGKEVDEMLDKLKIK